MTVHPTSIRHLRRRRAVLLLAIVLTAVLVLVLVRFLSGSAVAANGSRDIGHEIALLPGSRPAPEFEKTAEHGYIATGDTLELSDDNLPSIADLDPDLLAAMRAAAAAAADDGIHVVVTSGWRSSAYQQWLLDEAVARYGSLDEASKWVAAPDASHHVTGQAIDIGPFDATLWMQSNSEDFGLCQIYANEAWHYELADGGRCPELLDSAVG